MSADLIAQPFTLPSGAVVPNRLVKAAMTEGLADEWGRSTDALAELYRQWGAGGTGLLITGNFQIDRRYLERAGNVCLDGKQDTEQMARLKTLASAASAGGSHVWVQVSHAGRQCDARVCKQGVAPSAVCSSNLGGSVWSHLMPSYEPRELLLSEIEALPGRFAIAAAACKEAGFHGIQLHSAHGYLLSSFLSPKVNQRGDKYGGGVVNRVQLLLNIIKECRKATGKEFSIGVKMNSSDFQAGGFSHDDAIEVASILDGAGLDMIEISGGTYENPALLGGENVLESTVRREAYFLKYAADMRKRVSKTPLMVTGGMRSRPVIEDALKSGVCEFIGVGRPLAGMPNCSAKLIAKEIDTLPCFEHQLPCWPFDTALLRSFKLSRVVCTFACQLWYYRMFIAMGKGEKPDAKTYSPLGALLYMDGVEKGAATAIKGLTCEGTITNAKSGFMAKACAALVLFMAFVLFKATR